MSTTESPFYYLSHPYHAYKNGYCPLVGSAVHKQIEYNAHTYHLPSEICRMLVSVNDYFRHLIDNTPIPQTQRRLNSQYQVPDLCLSVLSRIDIACTSIGSLTLVAENMTCPHMYIGPLHYTKPARRQFSDINGLIQHYTSPFITVCDCRPITLYHKTRSSPVLGQNARNEVMSAAIALVCDLIRNVSPENSEVFDLFTNNSGHGPDEIDHNLWRDARRRAFSETTSTPPVSENNSYGKSTSSRFIAGFAYTPKHTHVQIVEVPGGLADGAARVCQFSEIDTFDEDIYRYYCC